MATATPKEKIAAGRVLSIAPEQLRADLSLNSRWREIPKDKIMERAQSMVANGQEQPIVVRPIEDNLFMVAEGYTRYLAGLLINRLGLMPGGGVFKLDAMIRDMNEEEAFAHSIIENYDHDPVTIVSTAHNVRTLSQKYKWPDERISTHYRIKKADQSKWLADLRKILRLSSKRQEEIEDGILNPAIGLVLAEIPEEAHEEILKEAEEIRKSRRGAEPVEETTVDTDFAEVEPATDPVGDATTEAPSASDGKRPKPRKAAAKKAKKKAAVKATKPAKSITKRDVVEAAKKKGLMKGKKVSRTIAQLREHWTPIAEDKKVSKLGRLAAAELAFYAGGDPDDYHAEIIALLK